MARLKINWDALGIGTSLACAIHCAVLPLFATSLPLFGVNIVHNHLFEAAMIALAFIIGITSLYHGYKRHHHSKTPILLFTIGILLLMAKEFIAHRHAVWLLIPAVVLIIVAHVSNYRSCRVHNHAHHEDCNH